jgi:hypothetical protein
MGRRELCKLQMNEKSLYLKILLDKATPNITLGANSITVNRENLIHDAI